MGTPFKHDPKCVFCQIVTGEAEASVVYRDAIVTAFMDLHPVTPGHTLVIPNQHAALITEVAPAAVGQMFDVGAQIDRAMRQSGLRCEAVSLLLSDGAAAGQVIFHSHLHVIPRFRGDSCGLRLHAGPVEQIPRAILDEQAKAIRLSLGTMV
jgi:histidine triad (HIT) family protein